MPRQPFHTELQQLSHFAGLFVRHVKSPVLSAGMAGGALGAAVPRVVAGAGAKGRGGAVKDRKDLKHSDSPQNLQRLVAEMAETPESVQHWHTDSENLDSLLAELRHKPGTHAVHVKSGKPTIAAPRL